MEPAHVSLRFGLDYHGVLGFVFDSARIFHVMLLGSLHALGRPEINRTSVLAFVNEVPWRWP